MRYAKQIPAADKELSSKLLSEGWTRLREPSNFTSTSFMALPFMLINEAISIAIAIYLYPPFKEVFISDKGLSLEVKLSIFTLVQLAVLLLFMALHEFIHAAFIPKGLKSENTFWGFNGLFAFVFTTEKIKKGRFLVICIMPWLLLSLALPFALSALGLLNGFTIFLCLINSMGSCVDCLNFFLVAFQAPRGSYIVNNGLETYYK